MFRPDRPLPAYIWPPSLIEPLPSAVIYLDLNHWIGLTKAANDHSDGSGYQAALQVCRIARRRHTAIFPLSLGHYLEVSKVGDARRRLKLALMMEELSEFTTILPRAVVAGLEIDSYLSLHAGPSTDPVNKLPLIGYGASWASGHSFSPQIIDQKGHDVFGEVRAAWSGDAESFDQVMLRRLIQFEREVLRGPDVGAIDDLRRNGWNPEAALKVAEDRAQDESEQSARLDAEPRW